MREKLTVCYPTSRQLFAIKEPENRLKDFVATFLPTAFGSKTWFPNERRFERQLLRFGCYLSFFLTILRRIQSSIFESSVRRRQNCIDNVFNCVNFAKKDFDDILSTG